MSDILSIIGKNLKTFRKRLGISQEKLAELAGLHRTYIGAVERGEKNISAKNIEKIARVLNVEPDLLLRDVNRFSICGDDGIPVHRNGSLKASGEADEAIAVDIGLPGQTAGIQEEGGPVEGTQKGRGETLLVVEDDMTILQMVEEILTNFNYTVLTAKSPSEAMQLAEAHPGEISLLLTDVVMPEMNGRELAEKMKSLYPRIKCLYMSGYTAYLTTHREVFDQGFNFIQKPFSTRELAGKVRSALDEQEKDHP